MKKIALFAVCCWSLWVPVSESQLFPAETRLSDADFLAAVNLDHPGLENVKAAVRERDSDRAKRELCLYYRARGAGFWKSDAESFSGESPVTGPFQRISEKTGDFSPKKWISDDEFNWKQTDSRFRRMYFFSSLGREYRQTGNEEIVKSWVNLFRAWVRQMPGDSNRLQMGIRLRSGWGDAFVSFVKSPSFDDESLFLFLKSFYEQALYLREKHSETSNWLTFEMAGLYSAGVLFPEWKEASEWRNYAVQTALNDLEKGWLPDGFTIELTPGYGTFFSNYLLITDLARETGHFSEALDLLIRKTERLYEPYLAMMTPDGNVPSWNDNSSDVDVRKLLAGALETFPWREDFRWAATGGREGRMPDWLSTVFPHAGYLIIRSGWEWNDNYLAFDAGPVGYRHAHQDKLGLVMWAYGRQVLYDPGRQNYDNEDPMQNYCMDTFSHSTGLVDNRPQRREWYKNPSPENMPYREPDDFKYDIAENAVWASGEYKDHYGHPGSVGNDAYPFMKDKKSNFREDWVKPASHFRQVAYAAPDIFIVQDRFVPNDSASHAYEIRWQLDSLKVETQGVRAETADAHKPNLAVIPLWTDRLDAGTVIAQKAPEIMGWKVLEKSYPAATLRHARSGSGEQGFLTWLFPLRPDETGGQIAFSEESGTILLTVGDGRRYAVEPAHGPEGRLSIRLLQ